MVPSMVVDEKCAGPAVCVLHNAFGLEQ